MHKLPKVHASKNKSPLLLPSSSTQSLMSFLGLQDGMDFFIILKNESV